MEALDKTLAEQLKITELEIEKRMSLLDFTGDDAELLYKFKPKVSRHLDGIVKLFYENQMKVPEIRLLIGDAETFRRLQSAMHRYVLDLFDGHYDMEYVNRRLRIGIVHQRIGVSSKLYLSAIYQLQRTIEDILFTHDFDEKNIMKIERVRKALNKIIMFDVQLVFDTYITSLVKQVDAVNEELQKSSEALQETIAEKTKQLKELSMRDGLTGLFNQRAFYEHLRRELGNAERYCEPLSLFYFDLDGFKNLNDTLGHQEGDKILKRVGEIINKAIRASDIGCRYGGDEFCIILPRTSIEMIGIVKDRLIKEFSSEQLHGVTFSMGIVDTGPQEFVDYETLVEQADQQMYKAKKDSKAISGQHISIVK